MLDQAEKLRQLVAQVEDNLTNKKTMKQEEIHTKIITVTSCKGAVENSDFVMNLSLELQRLNKKVLIFTTNIGMKNNISMDINPKYGIMDFVLNDKDINEILLEGPYGIKLLPGASDIKKIIKLTNNEKEIFFSRLQSLKEYDYIIMDIGADINPDILSFVSYCDNFMVILTPEPKALMDTYSVIKTIKHYDIKYIDNIKVVVSKVSSSKEGVKIFNALSSTAEKFLDISLDYLGYVQQDEKVSKVLKLQEPFILKFPNSVAAENIKSIVKKYLEMV